MLQLVASFLLARRVFVICKHPIKCMVYSTYNTIKIDFVGYFILVNIMTAARKCKQGFIGYSQTSKITKVPKKTKVIYAFQY